MGASQPAPIYYAPRQRIPPAPSYQMPVQYFPFQFSPASIGSWETVSSGKFLKSRITTTTYVRCGAINKNLPNTPLDVICPSCKARNFDGGLCKKVRCSKCGRSILRKENEEVIIVNQGNESPIDELFNECNNIPNESNYTELVSINIGIFRDSVSANFVTGGRAHFPAVFEFFLSPFFSAKRRCLGIGEYFKYGDAKFKVIGAFPAYGVIGKNTAIYCSQVLATQSVNKLHILPINGPLVTPTVFNLAISPFFKHRPQHISTGQYLYLNRQEYMIIASQPSDGIVTNNARFYFEGESLAPVQCVTVCPYFEELPSQYRTLSKEELIEEMMNFYILPYFQGSRKLITQGQDILIDGVNFLVENCYPPRGISHEHTGIIYEGSFKSRHIQPEVVFIPRSGYMSAQLGDLNRQLYHLQLLMQSMEIESEQTDQSVVQSLPEHTLTSLPANPEAARCMICLSDYEIGDTVKTLPCFHMFHPGCINQWLERSKFCPLCKTSVDISSNAE